MAVKTWEKTGWIIKQHLQVVTLNFSWWCIFFPLVFDLPISSQHLLDPVRLMLAQTSVKLLQVFTGFEHRLTPPQLHVKASPGKKNNEVQLCYTN